MVKSVYMQIRYINFQLRRGEGIKYSCHLPKNEKSACESSSDVIQIILLLFKKPPKYSLFE